MPKGLNWEWTAGPGWAIRCSGCKKGVKSESGKILRSYLIIEAGESLRVEEAVVATVMDPRVVCDADDVRGVVPGHREPAVDCANGYQR